MELIRNAFLHGGAIMYIIAFFGFAVVGLFVWRFYILFFTFDTPNPAGMWAEIYKMITNNQIESAIRICEKCPRRQIMPRVLKKGLQSASRSSTETAYAIESATAERLPLCARYLTWFGTIANITTLLGLLGTISGLISSFEAVASLSGAAKQQELAKGISHALFATGFGLGVALVAMLFHGILSGKANKVQDQTLEFASKILELLQLRRANLVSKSSSSGE
jgi:biopolymer transport protein ExbB